MRRRPGGIPSLRFGAASGGTSYDPLAKAADPTVVPLSSGTTSSSASARTFTSPTDGSGSYTLSVALVQDVGTGAVLAGDNSSGWYVTGLEDGDVCRIVGTWTDSVTGETVQNTFVVYVAPVSGSSWTSVLADDWTAEASQDLITGGDGNKTLGGRTWRATGTANADTWGPDGSTGIRFNANSGGAVRLATQIDNLSGVQADSVLWVWMSVAVISTGLSASGSYVGWQWNDVNNGPGTQGGQFILRFNAASDWRWRRTPRAGGGWGSNADDAAAAVTSEPTSARLALMISQGEVQCYGDINGATSAPNPADLTYLGRVDFGSVGASASTARRFGLYGHLLVGASTNITVVNCGVQRIEG